MSNTKNKINKETNDELIKNKSNLDTEKKQENKNSKVKELTTKKNNDNSQTGKVSNKNLAKNNMLENNNEQIEIEKTKSTNIFITLIKNEFLETKLLLKSVPSWVLLMFMLSVAFMNLFANKSIDTGLEWLALDCGIILSWASFLSMDMIVKRFGAKASTKISIIVLLVNLLISLTFIIVANISGMWGESFIEVGGDIANTALNNTLASSWYVILGSSVAFMCSAIINNILNMLIGKGFKKKNFLEYSFRTYISTMIGQFVDNLIFALIVSLNFFGWTLLQCVTCALTGAVVELLFEIVFSPLGFKVCKHWEKEEVGKEYLDFRESKKLNKAN